MDPDTVYRATDPRDGDARPITARDFAPDPDADAWDADDDEVTTED